MFFALGGLMFTSYPVAFILGGLAFVFGLIGWAAGLFEPIQYYNLIGRLWDPLQNLVLIAVPCFIYMGVMLERSAIAQDLLLALQTLLRRVPGGLALSITLMSTIMAAITGIVGASVVMMTLIALPTMLRLGYHPTLATGTIAASSTLGILIPPSILLVFMSEMLAVSEGVLFAAALFPGLLLSGLYLVYIFSISLAVPRLAPPLEARGEGPPPAELLRLACRGLLPPALLIFMVLGSIFAGIATITESAAVGALGATLLAWMRGRLTVAVLNESVQRSAQMIGMIFLLVLGATSFSYVFRVLGGDEVILHLVNVDRLGSWGVMVVLMATVFVMGFFFDILEILLIVVPVFAPIVERLDFAGYLPREDVIYWFATLVAVNLQTSFLTPPMGLALFYMKSAAPPEISMRQIYLGIIPFVCLQLLCVAIVMALPGIAMWLPHALFDR